MWVRVPPSALLNQGRISLLWLIILMGYLLGSTPTAYIAGRLLKGKDIRQMGDGNMGARNAFRQLGARTGILIAYGVALPCLVGFTHLLRTRPKTVRQT